MKRIAFLFPGQGSQYVGMGRGFYTSYEKVREVFHQASQILNFDLPGLCEEGPEDELRKTINTQPAIFTVSWGIYEILREKGIRPEVVAGHSLGEYTAAAAAEVMDYPSALKLIRSRAELMDKASTIIDGGMAAVIGLSREIVASVCQEIGGVEAVNFNSPSQIVISGENKKIKEAIDTLNKKGAKRVIFLPVSGPFHSSLMNETALKFSRELNKVSFSNPHCKIITNAFAYYALTADEVKKALGKQLNHPILWEDCMRKLVQDGVEVFVEVGPGKVLQGLMRRIDRKAQVLGVEKPEDMEKLLIQIQ
ncbi:MAG: ACP S-malonyltransferase [Candidatus Aerophobetes bacterium]|nr:ACP S-malonyltransferase [Candidatus Aerophobetes bacterium]